MQALGPDILEATAHAKTMSPEEIEETIDYLLNEVPSFSRSGALSLTSWVYCSTGKIPLVVA